MSTERDLALGIDTGGTYTDAAVIHRASGDVLATAKALTTPQDLSIGVAAALREVLAATLSENHTAVPSVESGIESRIGLVGLSTTLATNAIVEGRGHAACLLLIGYDAELLQRFDLGPRLITRDIVHITGGHDGAGTELAALDEETLCRAVTERLERVDGFAVSSYFSVRNPSHELRARELIGQLTGDRIAVTCGHELSAGLDSVRRATTTTLNARLIPLLRDLIQTVRLTLDDSGITAPLMVVKGDGSLVAAAWALQRPVETILSGPAASVIGAWHLGGRGDGWVVDVGGTTTDIAVLRGGLPRLDPEGARVGGWQTMVETVHVRTVGLGGDSHVHIDLRQRHKVLRLGPRRVTPLSLLALDHDQIDHQLRQQLAARREGPEVGQFGVALGDGHAIPERTRSLWQRLKPRPVALAQLVDASPFGALVLGDVDTLEAHRALQRAAFTPTDALHVLGRYQPYNTEVARLGAQLLAVPLGMTAAAFCERVVDQFGENLLREVVGKILTDEGDARAERSDAQTHGSDPLLDRAVGIKNSSDLGCTVTLRQPLIGVGAPVRAFLPAVAKMLQTELVVPPHAQVANAVGAIAGGVVLHLRVIVRPTERDDLFHALLPEGTYEVTSIEEGVQLARKRVPPLLHQRMVEAGAGDIDVRVARDDVTAPLRGGWGTETLIETELLFTAVGAPATPSP